MIDEKEILSSAMITVVEDSIKATWEKVKKFFKDLDSKESIRYRTAYQNYLINTENRYGRIKTIIHRHVPKNIYDFYECVGVRYNGEMYATRTINDILKIGHRILITGTGGLGKSMLFKHFYLNTIQETDYIPVLIELRSYNNFEIKDISIYQSIYKTLCDNGFDLSEEYFEYSMKEGAYIGTIKAQTLSNQIGVVLVFIIMRWIRSDEAAFGLCTRNKKCQPPILL